MPSPLQSPSSRRKIVYLGLILLLFVVNTFFWRGVASPLTGGQAPAWTVQGQAAKLELTEETQGEADLLGATLRLVLTGSRGLATTVLWQSAIDKQKKNEWNELEFIVRSLTKLQPHFLTPWLFQSWNLSYNVSVESDRVKDKYFYISRGIELLAQGERLNKDNPDMRYWIAFYYQNKFGVSDENSTLRSLFQLSCIPPEERNPDIIAPKDPRTQRRKVNEAEFEKFCQQHPQLVRRLREPPRELDLKKAFKCDTPEDVVEFLEKNRRVPCRYFDADEERGQLIAGKAGDLKPAGQQFPVLPATQSRYDSKGVEPTAADKLDDTFGAFAAARAWFAYAQDPLPDPDPLADAIDRKLRIKTLNGRRLPKQPAEVLFRQSPCRAQSYIGEYLHKEGWFDNSGWTVDAGRSGPRRWFPNRAGDVVIGAGKDYSTDAWTRAYSMWREYGEQNGMLFKSAADEINLQNRANKIRQRFQVNPGDQLMGIRPETLDEEMQDSLKAQRLLAIRGTNLGMTNFMHHYTKAEAERDRETAQARKTIDRAVWFHRSGDPDREIETFEKGFEQWKAVLMRHPDFRDDSATQEELYEMEVRYLGELQKYRGDRFRPALIFQGLATAAAESSAGVASPATAATGFIYSLVDERALPLPILGPLDGDYSPGKPWIQPSAMITVRQRLFPDKPHSGSAPPPKQAPTEPRRGGRG